MFNTLKDLTGQRFARLVVDRRDENAASGNARWLCRCDCGESIVVAGNSLRSGNTRSCGCLRREVSAVSVMALETTTHGQSAPRTPTYRTWEGMVARTTNPHRPEWGYYGGRGITLCDRWRSFENFLVDMGERPAGLTLDRIDNNGNYEPGNCRWATWSQQQLNKRTSRKQLTS